MNQAAIDKLRRIRTEIIDLLGYAVEVLTDYPEVAHRSYETWVARIDAALGYDTEFCDTCDYTLMDAIEALKKARRAA